MNLAEVLMNADKKKITDLQTKEYEVKRLSNLLGTPFILTLKEIPPKRVMEINQQAVKMNINKKEGQNVDVDVFTLQMLTLVEGIKSGLGDRELLKAYGCATVKELYVKIFKAKEISDIAEAINSLGSYTGDDRGDIAEVKN